MNFRRVVLMFSILFTGQLSGQDSWKWTGFWKGDISAMGTKIGIILEVTEKKSAVSTDTKNGDSKSKTALFKSTLDVPMQGARGITVSKTDIHQSHIEWEIESIGARCVGTRKDSVTIEAQWSQGGKTLPLTLRWSPEKYLLRYQTPKPPYAYNTRSASFSHPSGKLIFGGTLTIPNDSLYRIALAANPKLAATFPIPSKATVIRREKRGDEIREITDGIVKYPAVLLISGSGSQDREESIADHKPFAVWADYLTRNGMAVLRVDDRGVGASKGQPEFIATTTTESLVEDAAAALRWLKQQPDIDTNFIFIVGHSEGANIAIKVAAKEPNLRGVVSLAGMTQPGIETTIYQLRPLWQKNTNDAETLEQLSAITRRMAQASQYHRNPAAAKKFVKDTLLKVESSKYKKAIQYLKKYDLPASGKKDIEALLSTQIGESYQIPWIQYYLHFDPRPEYKSCQPALLLVQGGKDLQINPKATKALVQEMTQQGQYVSLLEFGNLNHLFQHTQTGEISEYFTLDETLALEVQAGVMRWFSIQLQGR